MNRLQDMQPKKSGHPARATANSGPLEGNQPGLVIAAGLNPAHPFGRPVTRAEPAKRHSLRVAFPVFELNTCLGNASADSTCQARA